MIMKIKCEFETDCKIQVAASGTFLGYFKTSKAHRVYNVRTLTIEESIHVNFNDSKPDKELSELDDSFVGIDLGVS
ncbi:hypothetical protein CR513_17447, partial [Mucuna pruriens]